MSDKVRWRPSAISLSPVQNASSRLTLVLWRARTIECLTTGDFTVSGFDPWPVGHQRYALTYSVFAVVNRRHRNRRISRHCGGGERKLERGKNHTVWIFFE